ncbi:MAG TPA: glycerol-3-phosphate 1-O-acyltransferase PlsY [Sedimentisphaerales bacterium]|nr:glycerol-3-phosphate 1-O-acyltransferase PlsY [Sedimentisphaerales bacterium]
MTYVVFIAVAYLLGSIPFAFLIAQAHGKDLRTIGSGNIGATNLARALGRKWGYICFALDALKAFIPMVALPAVAGRPDNPALLALWLAVGIAAILGHVYPVTLGFKGGKGVATSFGVALGLWPYFTIAGLIALVVWVVVVLIWRYVSLASICGAVAFPVALVAGILIVPAWTASSLWPLLIAAVAIPTMVIVRHRENVKRLLAGTESKIRDKTAK